MPALQIMRSSMIAKINKQAKSLPSMAKSFVVCTFRFLQSS